MSLTVIVMTGTALCFILGLVAGMALDRKEKRREEEIKARQKD